MAKRSNVLYIGIGGHVLALDSATGEEIWRRKLQSNTFQTILVRDGRVYAGVGGELSCLDGATGEILWTNKLKGLGMGLISFSAESEIAMETSAQAQAAATIAAT